MTMLPQEKNDLDIDKQILKHFRVVISAMKENFQNIERVSGLSSSQLWALSLIKNTPGLKVHEVAATMSILRASASNLLDKLEERSLIRRERKDNDQRVVRLYATEAGIDLINRIPSPPEGIIVHAIQHLTSADQRLLEQSLSKLVEELKYKNEQASLTPLADI